MVTRLDPDPNPNLTDGAVNEANPLHRPTIPRISLDTHRSEPNLL